MENKPQTKESLETEKVYDSAFWTAVSKMRGKVVPLINEAFNETLPAGARVELLPMKNVTRLANGSHKITEVDSLIAIITGDCSMKKCYHFECQVKEEAGMAIRIAEYGTGAAFENAVETDDGADLTFPYSAVLLLRSSEHSRNDYIIRIKCPGGEISYSVPVIKVTDYDIRDITEKQLWILLPFYGFRYAKDLKQMEKAKSIGTIKEDIERIAEELNKAVDSKLLNGYEKHELLYLIKRVFDKLTIRQDYVRKEVDEIMGGTILKSPWDEAEERGEIHGREMGEIQRGIKDAERMYADGISFEKIASYVGETVETVKAWLLTPTETA